MDCTIESPSSSDERTIKLSIITTPSARTIPTSKDAAGSRLQRRVHFSTKNSMVQLPRSNSFHYERIGSPDILSITSQQPHQFSYESVYSNEYEPIGSEVSAATSNHYVDMDVNPHNAPLFNKLSKQPPALPPKPNNLLKIRNVVRSASSFGIASPLPLSCEDIDNELEPDYASILEVCQPLHRVKTQEVVAEVHKSDDSISNRNSVDLTMFDFSADDSFADVPKLPNVAAIISPKKDLFCPSVITQDNYVTRSPVNPKENNRSPQSLVTLNSRSQPITLISTQHTPQPLKQMTAPKTHCQQSSVNNNVSSDLPIPLYEDKLQLQAEFDWYNLDVEYSCKNKKDPNNEIENSPNVASIEYNLDEEYNISTVSTNAGEVNQYFGKSSAPEKTVIDDVLDVEHDIYLIDKCASSHMQHVPLNANHSVNNPLEEHTFETFLKDRGLTTKPLPRKRKIFY